MYPGKWRNVDLYFLSSSWPDSDNVGDISDLVTGPLLSDHTPARRVFGWRSPAGNGGDKEAGHAAQGTGREAAAGAPSFSRPLLTLLDASIPSEVGFLFGFDFCLISSRFFFRFGCFEADLMHEGQFLRNFLMFS